MDHVECLAAEHTSFRDFFLNTIVATHPKHADAEMAGLSRLMEIVTAPTEEEIADLLEQLAYSDDQWEEFEQSYSSVVNAADKTDIISLMVKLRKVQSLWLLSNPFAHHSSQTEVMFKEPSATAIWAEKVVFSILGITAAKLWEPHARKRTLKRNMETAMFNDQYEKKMLEWAEAPDGADKQAKSLQAFRLVEKNRRAQRKNQEELYEVVSSSPSPSQSYAHQERQFGAAAISQSVFCPVSAGKVKTRSDGYALFLSVFRESFEDRLDESQDSLLDDYCATSGQPVEAQGLVRHWRESSHEAHRELIVMVVTQVLGAPIGKWVDQWFADNEPSWCRLIPLNGVRDD